MLRVFNGRGCEVDPAAPGAIWFDLLAPTPEEEARVEAILGVDVPTPAERDALEDSGRNYLDRAILVLTPTLLGRREEGAFVSGPVSFVLTGERLVTVREIDPRAFEVGQGRASARIDEARDGAAALVSILQGVIERTVDLILELDVVASGVAAELFGETERPNLKATLKSIGRTGALASLTQSSLSSLGRCLIFLQGSERLQRPEDGAIAVMIRDVEELERQLGALQARLGFLQDSALGLINERQTNVLKTLSIAAIGFIPATLVASIFGMNFEAMAWYQRAWGPVAAFALMVGAPALLLTVARWRKWF